MFACVSALRCATRYSVADVRTRINGLIGAMAAGVAFSQARAGVSGGTVQLASLSGCDPTVVTGWAAGCVWA
jgi:hypothetical protein